MTTRTSDMRDREKFTPYGELTDNLFLNGVGSVDTFIRGVCVRWVCDRVREPRIKLKPSSSCQHDIATGLTSEWLAGTYAGWSIRSTWVLTRLSVLIGT
jgi:hypothetical protein